MPPSPRRTPASSRRTPASLPARWLLVGIVVLALAGTWLAGGFEKATDRLTRLPVGTEVDLGPMSFAADRAQARQRTNSWTVYVFGRCRNNTDAPLASTKDRLVRNAFSMQHPVNRQVTAEASLFFGPGETLGKSDVLNPGTPMVPCTLVFDPDEFPATDYISVGASELEWIDASPTGEGQMVWSASRMAYRFEVPVVIEPA
ncbi:hypothetical protein [Micropruina sp.]|uniref:hypothetical protein n=1 Tax=Micropruina sp. TaxID=2737536 RepID=UPI002611E231|nr:hypothetical protein [Micropruina sp.]